MPLEADIVVDAVEKWAGVLLAWLRSRTDSPEDVMQETFCRLANLDEPPKRTAAWLFQVALNLCHENVRRYKRRLQREQGRVQGEFEADRAHDLVVHQEVRDAVESLPVGLRDVVIARLWGELTLEETSELLGLSVSTVHRRYHESLEVLRQKLAEPDKSR